MKKDNDINIERWVLQERSNDIASFLKGVANKHRLLILHELLEGEKNVSQLIDSIGIPQTSMSQHLSKLKEERIVDYRREHRTLYYSIISEPTREIMQILYRSIQDND